MIDPDPCSALGCALQDQPIKVCRDHRCPHRWQRESREDRAKREEKDRGRPSRPLPRDLSMLQPQAGAPTLPGSGGRS